MRRRMPSPPMLVALLALFVALGGSSYAALRLPKNSVGSRQLKKNSVKSSKVKNGSLLVRDFKSSQRALLRGPQGPPGERGAQGVKGDPGAPGATNVVERIDDSDGTGVSVAAGATFTASVSCAAGERATGGGGESGFGGDANQPLSFVTLAASQPTPPTGVPTGWSVTFRNDDTTAHILAHKVWVICASP